MAHELDLMGTKVPVQSVKPKVIFLTRHFSPQVGILLHSTHGDRIKMVSYAEKDLKRLS